MSDPSDFLYPRSRYEGQFNPNNPNSLIFNANLQEFSQKVALICALETNGKVTPLEAYQRIKELWQELESSRQDLFG